MIALIKAITAFLEMATTLMKLYAPIIKHKAASERFHNDINKAAEALNGTGDDIAAEFERTEMELLSKGLIIPPNSDSGKE